MLLQACFRQPKLTLWYIVTIYKTTLASSYPMITCRMCTAVSRHSVATFVLVISNTIIWQQIDEILEYMGYYYCYTTLCKDLPSDKQLTTILLNWCKCMKSEMLKIREACSCKHMPITPFALLDGDMSLTDEPCKVLHSHTLDLYLNEYLVVWSIKLV